MHFELDLLGAHRHTQRCLCIIFLDGLIDFGLQLIQTVHWFIRYTWFPDFLILVRMSASTWSASLLDITKSLSAPVISPHSGLS